MYNKNEFTHKEKIFFFLSIVSLKFSNNFSLQVHQCPSYQHMTSNIIFEFTNFTSMFKNKLLFVEISPKRAIIVFNFISIYLFILFIFILFSCTEGNIISICLHHIGRRNKIFLKQWSFLSCNCFTFLCINFYDLLDIVIFFFFQLLSHCLFYTIDFFACVLTMCE